MSVQCHVTIVKKAGPDKVSAQALESEGTANLGQYYEPEPMTVIC